MKLLLAASALAIASFGAPAFAQQASVHADLATTTEPSPPEPVIVPTPSTVTSVETSIDRTPDAIVETRKETITPHSGRPALDPNYPIAPEVQAVVSSGKKYTTKDIVSAQLEAMKKTPISTPTQVITTTTITPVG